MMIDPGSVWAFFGIPGLREVGLVILVTLVLYGRSGLQHTPYARALRPWLSLARRVPVPPGPPRPAPRASRLGDRVFWVLALTAMTAVAAWVVTRTLIVGGPGASR